MFQGFFGFVANILNWFYSVIPSFGAAIALLTVTVMVVITPLTLKSTKSMLQMQRLQPQLRKLQEQYKGDRERLSQEMMAFYKEHNLNPLSGCIPVLAQMPVFIVMYQVLRGLTVRVGGGASGIGHISGELLSDRSGLTPWRLTDQPFQPQHLDRSAELYQSLITRSKMNFLGVDLSISPSQSFKLGIAAAIPFVILMVLLLVSQIIQNRQIQGRTQQQMPSQQQALMKILPFMLPIFSFSFPAGLGYYYFIQGLCRIGTQAYITRKFYGESAPADSPIDVAAKPSKKEPPVPAPPRKQSPKSKAVQKKQAAPGARRSGERPAGRRRSGEAR